jgi:hypothetical protein
MHALYLLTIYLSSFYPRISEKGKQAITCIMLLYMMLCVKVSEYLSCIIVRNPANTIVLLVTSSHSEDYEALILFVRTLTPS